MKAVSLLIEPFHFISITNVECRKELNRHGTLRITGLIHADDAEAYMEAATQETWVTMKAAEEEQEVLFFQGILTALRVRAEGGVHILTAEIKTGSYLLDLIPHTRSFQDSSLSYKAVIETCLKKEGGECIVEEKRDNPIHTFLLQYRETDWEFLMRLAGRAGTFIKPEFETGGKRCYFGNRSMEPAAIIADSYTLDKKYEELEQKKANGRPELTWPDMFEYVVQSRSIHNLGDWILFYGRTFLVGKIESYMKGEELCHNYTLITLKNAACPAAFNQKAKGASLRGRVIQVERDRISVSIHEDENKEHSGTCWFDYGTVYSTPEGTGWYCMPEIGDEVRLIFPDDEEEHAYAASSVHLETGEGRSNPSEKSWKNRQNKEILFTPEALILRNNDGMSIELSDKEGILINSNKNIAIQADGPIQISSSQAGIDMNGAEQISLNQGGASIVMKEEINISGGKINMN